MRGDHRYCANYCEENVWQLAREPSLLEGPRRVVFITNATKSVAVFHQRSAPEPHEPVVWDYHVILAIVGRGIYDLDSTLPFPCPIREYLDAAFRPVAARFRPKFRLIDADEYVEGFSSDRAHMRRADGSFQSPPPSWPAPAGSAFVLAEVLDLSRRTPGAVLDLTQLSAALGA